MRGVHRHKHTAEQCSYDNNKAVQRNFAQNNAKALRFLVCSIVDGNKPHMVRLRSIGRLLEATIFDCDHGYVARGFGAPDAIIRRKMIEKYLLRLDVVQQRAHGVKHGGSDNDAGHEVKNIKDDFKGIIGGVP